MGNMNPQMTYSRLAEIIAAALRAAREAGDTEFEGKLRDLEIMTLDRLYIAMDGLEGVSHSTAGQKGRVKTRRSSHLQR